MSAPEGSGVPVLRPLVLAAHGTASGAVVANDPRNEAFWTAQAAAFAGSAAYATYDYSRYVIYTDVNRANPNSRQEFIGTPPPRAVVPEPGTLLLVGAGLAGAGAWAARRRRNA